jgi:hypothetical protein
VRQARQQATRRRSRPASSHGERTAKNARPRGLRTQARPPELPRSDNLAATAPATQQRPRSRQRHRHRRGLSPTPPFLCGARPSDGRLREPRATTPLTHGHAIGASRGDRSGTDAADPPRHVRPTFASSFTFCWPWEQPITPLAPAFRGRPGGGRAGALRRALR